MLTCHKRFSRLDILLVDMATSWIPKKHNHKALNQRLRRQRKAMERKAERMREEARKQKLIRENIGNHLSRAKPVVRKLKSPLPSVSPVVLYDVFCVSCGGVIQGVQNVCPWMDVCMYVQTATRRSF